MTPLRIGTRGSALALWQADAVAAALRAAGADVEIVRITTQGDRRQEAPLSEAGGKGIFVKEIEEALDRHDIDIAVHSAKDMAAVLPDGLAIAAVLPREDPRDALVLRAGSTAEGLHPPGNPEELRYGALGDSPRLGTSSPRRVAQLRARVPGATFQAIRGNVDTRLRKLDEGAVDALILASAGLLRLGLGHRISASIPVAHCMPAPGQGIVAVQVRSDDERAYSQVAPMNDPLARLALTAEQSTVAALGGGCQLPLGVFAEVNGTELVVRGVAASLDGRHIVAGETRGRDLADAAGAGRRLAENLIARGARTILES